MPGNGTTVSVAAESAGADAAGLSGWAAASGGLAGAADAHAGDASTIRPMDNKIRRMKIPACERTPRYFATIKDIEKSEFNRNAALTIWYLFADFHPLLRRWSGMDQMPVESSVFSWLRYFDEYRVLETQFRDGNVYRYFHVPPDVWEEFREASSKGAYFATHIRDRYDYRKISAKEKRPPFGEPPLNSS